MSIGWQIKRLFVVLVIEIEEALVEQIVKRNANFGRSIDVIGNFFDPPIFKCCLDGVEERGNRRI